MKIDCLPLGQYEENCYILHENGHVLVIDPGCKGKEAIKACQGDTIDAILLTHGHSDHTVGVDEIVDQVHCPVYISDDDMQLISNNPHNLNLFGSVLYCQLEPLKIGSNDIGNFNVKVLATPGHTEGSVCIQYKNVLFTGDTLFAGDIGRTDLFSGSEAQMSESLEYLTKLPSDLIIYPGHGPSSTMAQEKISNPYLR